MTDVCDVPGCTNPPACHTVVGKGKVPHYWCHDHLPTHIEMAAEGDR